MNGAPTDVFFVEFVVANSFVIVRQSWSIVVSHRWTKTKVDLEFSCFLFTTNCEIVWENHWMTRIPAIGRTSTILNNHSLVGERFDWSIWESYRSKQKKIFLFISSSFSFLTEVESRVLSVSSEKKTFSKSNWLISKLNFLTFPVRQVFVK